MTKKTKLYAFVIIALTCAITFVVADLFSSILTVGNFAFLPTQGLKSSKYSIYALALLKTTTSADASSQSQEVKLRGGAGYVYFADAMYYLLASGYESENDAIKVQENLEENKTSSEIIEIIVGEIIIDMSLSGSEKTAMTNALGAFKTIYKNLYDISVSLDTSVKNLPECKLLVNAELESLNTIKTSFDSAFLGKLTSEVFKIKLNLAELFLNVQQLTENSTDQKVLYSAYIKETYLKSIVLNKSLTKELTTWFFFIFPLT